MTSVRESQIILYRALYDLPTLNFNLLTSKHWLHISLNFELYTIFRLWLISLYGTDRWTNWLPHIMVGLMIL